jgi:hypothetical protein
MDTSALLKNRHRFPHNDLDKYAGQYVAWSPDGTRIIASNADPLRLIAAVDAAGYDHEQTLVEAIPLPDEVILGGGILRGEEIDG